jgi:hypothetical protein
MGRVPSFATDENSHSAAYSLNVGNLRDTSHSAEAKPPAASAEQPPPIPSATNLHNQKNGTPQRPVSIQLQFRQAGNQLTLGSSSPLS